MANYTITRLNADIDTYILISASTTNFGTDTILRVGHPLTVTGAIGLVQWDLSSIPPGSTINEAIFSLTTAEVRAVTSIVESYRLVRQWVELEATWNIAETAVNWGTAGAGNTTTDYNSTLLGTMTFATTKDDTQQVDITQTVSDWFDGTNSNFGLRLFNAGASNAGRQFYSSENSANRKPQLLVSYTSPHLDYQLNGNDIDCGIQARWAPIVTGLKSDATQKTSTDWRGHSWTIETCEMPVWEILETAKGTIFSELKTTGEDDPNVVATYSTGRVRGVTGQQVGRRMEGVRVDFLVDITS